jgi:putative hydrolase of the HAD superfamily
MIKAVIFDMGNTLLQYRRPGDGTWREFEALGIRSVYRYLVEQGHPLPEAEEAFVDAMFARLAEGWIQATAGTANLRLPDWIAEGMATHNLALDDAALVVAASHYARPIREGAAPTPGAVETLAALRARGIATGLISNTVWPGELHLEDLAALGLLPHLQHVLFSGDYGVWKPQPAVFRHMLELLGVSAEETVFVGDSPEEDIVGAQRVGMRAVWMRSGFPLGEVRPDAVIESLPELLPLLEPGGFSKEGSTLP